MPSSLSKIYTDDVSLVVVVVDTNPFFWAAAALPFADFFAHLVHFVNSILLLNHLNRVVVIAAGVSTCSYVFDSSDASAPGGDGVGATFEKMNHKMEEFIAQDANATKGNSSVDAGNAASLLSGALSLALCYIQRIFRSGTRHPQPRILCLQGSQDGPEQYVAVMNSIFSAQRSMVPIDSCIVGTEDSAFLQQASYITGGIYLKPQELNGLFEYLAPSIYPRREAVQRNFRTIQYSFRQYQLPSSNLTKNKIPARKSNYPGNLLTSAHTSCPNLSPDLRTLSPENSILCASGS